jgi:hypothetical protein
MDNIFQCTDETYFAPVMNNDKYGCMMEHRREFQSGTVDVITHESDHIEANVLTINVHRALVLVCMLRKITLKQNPEICIWL